MKKIVLMAVFPLFIAVLFSCLQRTNLENKTISPADIVKSETPGKESRERKWEEAIIHARKERKVTIYTGVAPITRTEISRAFGNKHKDIEVEFVAGGGVELSQKIISQRRAGLNLVDLYISGTTTMINTLKPAGVFDPFDSVLILPQVYNPDVWWQRKLPYVDKDHTIFSFVATLGGEGNVAVNTEATKAQEIISYYDLLGPKFQEKIVLTDPTIAGKGQRNTVFLALKSVLGWDYFRELMKQKPVITRNSRIQLEWIAQKKFLVGIFPDEGIALEFRDAGVPIEVSGGLKEDVPYVVGSFGQISLMNMAPHPNAAKIFANWLLDREGQEIWGRTTLAQSARADVNADYMLQARKPVRQANLSYHMLEDEEYLLKEPEFRKTLMEIFNK